MTQFIKLIVIIFLLTSQVYAASDLENKEDKPLIRNYDNISFKESKHVKTKKMGPLGNKKWGIEINLIRLLFIDTGKDEFVYTFSGGVSLFNINRQVELAFPIFYSHVKYKDEDEYEESLRQFTLDCHYRRFLGKTQKGFYISGFIRYANIRGTKLGDWDNYWYNGYEEPKRSTENKIGIGFGIGYRIFSHMGIYWGVSLNIGIYLIGENYIFTEDDFFLLGKFKPDTVSLFDNDSIIIFNFELLKFGWAF
ncbi:MAG: DUF3575 domain-containing protein [Candidatus Celaenobacter antarcticus]|nr:DUF3575 domain-containing protein [Candidatus Celaenobacter antarcticus]